MALTVLVYEVLSEREEREREIYVYTEREKVCVCVCESERSVRKREKSERESVCERERKSEKRERERARARAPSRPHPPLSPYAALPPHRSRETSCTIPTSASANTDNPVHYIEINELPWFIFVLRAVRRLDRPLDRAAPVQDCHPPRTTKGT